MRSELTPFVVVVAAAFATVARADDAFDLELRSVAGAPLASAPRVELVYEADLEIPWLSQKCRGFNWLATGPMCQPTTIDTTIAAVAHDDGSWWLHIPSSVPAAVRHSLKSADLVLPGSDRQALPLSTSSHERRAIVSESVRDHLGRDPGSLSDVRVFAATLHGGDRGFDVAAMHRFGLRFRGHEWSFKRHFLYVDQAISVMREHEASLRSPEHLRRAVGPGCFGGSLTVFTDEAGVVLWGDDVSVVDSAAGVVDHRRSFHFFGGQLLALDHLGSSRSTTVSTEYAVFRDHAPIDWTAMGPDIKVMQAVWRVATAEVDAGDVATNSPPPDAAWRADVDRCVERIRALAVSAEPLGAEPH